MQPVWIVAIPAGSSPLLPQTLVSTDYNVKANQVVLAELRKKGILPAKYADQLDVWAGAAVQNGVRVVKRVKKATKKKGKARRTSKSVKERFVNSNKEQTSSFDIFDDTDDESLGPEEDGETQILHKPAKDTTLHAKFKTALYHCRDQHRDTTSGDGKGSTETEIRMPVLRLSVKPPGIVRTDPTIAQKRKCQNQICNVSLSHQGCIKGPLKGKHGLTQLPLFLDIKCYPPWWKAGEPLKTFMNRSLQTRRFNVMPTPRLQKLRSRYTRFPVEFIARWWSNVNS
mmetsp:Transcript_130949/g.184516  ORF Transcript_130949/g.184516 Transcript_130949/m.184516 type:complete len:284 (-) Transcript_130949:199-1050(-)